MKKKNIFYILGAVIALIFIVLMTTGGEAVDANNIEATVECGDFEISVVTTGELEAKNSEEIHGPSGLRQVRIWQVQISDMIADGTVVDSGQYVADLDRSEISNKIKDMESELEKLESQYIKTRLDTSMDLRAAREELINMEFELEEKKITLEQSIYEPPATIRQAQINFDKAKRAFEQSNRNYKLKYEKAEATMQEVSASFNQTKRRYAQAVEIRDQFTVTAPKAGMVVYKREWNGKKRGVGSQLGAWDNVVATLPNLEDMISKTYVNEIDISKVNVGQKVKIGVDAFPDKAYTGEVLEVANIGEQLQNSNAKVFEVRIQVNEFDSILRPAMTTKNAMITGLYHDVLSIPIECVHGTDSLSYVFMAKQRVKKQVVTGKSNEDHIVIEKGLKAGDVVLLNLPENAEKYDLNLIKD